MDDPFVRFSRDRQGYEHFFIMHLVQGRRGKVRQRILYWFRTPPHVKMGREPFDDSVRRALEAQNPSLRFDWNKIRNTAIPPAQPEHWRERRLADRAARQVEASAKPEPEAPQVEAEPEAPQDAAGQPPVAVASGVEESRRSRRRRRRRGGGVGYPAGTRPRIEGESGPAGQTASAPPSSIESDGAFAATPSPGSPASPSPDSDDTISPFSK